MDNAEIVALSLNHSVTPLEVRERVAFDREEGERFLAQIAAAGELNELLLVSTCNRTEVYGVGAAGAAGIDATFQRTILDALAAQRGFAPRESPRNFIVATAEQAVRHFFRVAAGLDSQILGESQILGQVKRSIEWSRNAGTSGRVLHRLWERALRVGKRVRNETALGEGALSASYAALELARKIFGTIEGRSLLVIGAGEIAVLALQSLHGVRLGGLQVMNRTRSRAEELAAEFGGRARDMADLPAALAEVDIVISSTGSREPIVRVDVMRKARAQRGGNRPLLIIDLAVPRDIEEACGSIDEVFLKNLDDLSEIVHGNLSERRSEIPRAEAIVDAEVTTFLHWLGTLDVEPTIRKFRDTFHEIRREELEALRNALDRGTFEVFERLTYRLVNRLLHLPSENLRRHPGRVDQELVAFVHQLLTERIPHRNEREGGEP